MEPEPDRIDLSPLDPRRDDARWDHAVATVAQRAIELRRLRRAVVRRGTAAVLVAAAAALVLWLAASRPDVTPRPERADLLDWATHDVTAEEVLQMGVGHAQ